MAGTVGDATTPGLQREAGKGKLLFCYMVLLLTFRSHPVPSVIVTFVTSSPGEDPCQLVLAVGAVSVSKNSVSLGQERISSCVSLYIIFAELCLQRFPNPQRPLLLCWLCLCLLPSARSAANSCNCVVK